MIVQKQNTETDKTERQQKTQKYPLLGPLDKQKNNSWWGVWANRNNLEGPIHSNMNRSSSNKEHLIHDDI
jgi:hypothetical protein